MNIWWTIHLRREAASVPLARRVLLGTMESVGVDPQVSHDIGIALTEACANVVEHAGGGAPDEYQVTVTIDHDRCGVEVVDFGLGFGEDGLPASDDADPAPPEPAPEDPGFELSAAMAGSDQDDWFLSDTAALFSGAPISELAWSATEPGTAAAPDGGTRTATVPETVAVCPADPTAESGRGLFLIRALVDHVQFRNHPCRGAVVSFDKALRWKTGGGALLRAS